MAQVEGSGYCPTCGRQRLLHRQGTNHVLHLVLTVLTLGIWGVFWLITAVSNKGTAPWRCSVCGTRIMRLHKAKPPQNDETPLDGGVSAGHVEDRVREDVGRYEDDLRAMADS